MNFIRAIFVGLALILIFLFICSLPALVLHGEHDAIFIVLMVLLGLFYSLKKLLK